jgi:hypothetical protein
MEMNVIARSVSDDPSTLAAQATPGWESAEALCAKAEAIQLFCRERKLDCFASLAMTLKQPGAFSRHCLSEFGKSRCPSREKRAQGKPGADCARSTVCNGRKNAHG